MNSEKPLTNTILFAETLLAGLRTTLQSKYKDESFVLGAELGADVRSNLPEGMNLKSTFGGLRKFINNYFPNDIKLCGKKGKDDLYTISFLHTDKQVQADSTPADFNQTIKLATQYSTVDIAKKAIEFLSVEELEQLRLPLGAISKAIKELIKG